MELEWEIERWAKFGDLEREVKKGNKIKSRCIAIEDSLFKLPSISHGLPNKKIHPFISMVWGSKKEPRVRR